MLLIMTVIWGGTFVVVKVSLNDVSPMMFVILRFTLAAFLLFPFAYRNLLKLDSKSLRSGLILGISMGLGFIAQTAGLKFTTATKSGFITGTVVIFTPVLQFFMLKKRPHFSVIAGSLVVLLGLVFLSAKGSDLNEVLSEIGTGFNTGDFLTLAGAVFFALYIILLDVNSRKIETFSLVFLQISATAVLALLSAAVFVIAGVETPHAAFTPSLIAGLIYTALPATIITTVIQTRYQKNLSPAQAGIIYTFEPAFAAVFAYCFLAERMTFLASTGCVIIASGLIISEVFKDNK